MFCNMKLKAWRRSLQKGDPVNFYTGITLRSGEIYAVESDYFIIKSYNAPIEMLYCVRLLNEVYPFNPEISQAPQECDLGLTRPTAKHHVDHSGQNSRQWWQHPLAGLFWLFSFLPAKRPSMMDPGGSLREG